MPSRAIPLDLSAGLGSVIGWKLLEPSPDSPSTEASSGSSQPPERARPNCPALEAFLACGI